MKRNKRKRRGFTLIEIAAVATLISTIPATSYIRVRQKADQTKSQQQLKQIGLALKMYQQENETYPKAAFYPKKPDGKDSIITELKDHGAVKQLFICPSLPQGLQKKGLTFVYNDEVSGKRRLRKPAKKWVLIEINCVAKKSPKPHPNGYNILFADGHVISSKVLPAKITKMQQAHILRIKKDMMRAALDEPQHQHTH